LREKIPKSRFPFTASWWCDPLRNRHAVLYKANQLFTAVGALTCSY
jgi:hypothetical protein